MTMGYSCNSIDSDVYAAMVSVLQSAHGDAGGSSNSWGKDAESSSFAEIGRERDDGAVSGTVWVSVGANRCRKAGGFRVAGGVVVRWPGSTAEQRKRAKSIGAGVCAARGARVGAW